MFGNDNQDNNTQYQQHQPNDGGYTPQQVDDDQADETNPNYAGTTYTPQHVDDDSTPQGAPDVDKTDEPATPAVHTAGAVSDDLLELKQKAVQQLSPLVGHLDQTPEEKFRTTMMMIQATDNKELLPSAYEAAQSITDEKAKAQALLDVINEINYFTQAHK